MKAVSLVCRLSVLRRAATLISKLLKPRYGVSVLAMLSCNSRPMVFSRLIILAGEALAESPPAARIVPSVLKTVT